MKIALVYDRVNKWGGAERVLLSLHEIWPKAPLFTSLYNPQTAPWAAQFKVIPSFLNKFPFLRRHHEIIPFLIPLAFESFNFDEFDIVISITCEFAKGIITKPQTLHLCYCLTPTRYLWSGYQDYFRSSIFQIVSSPVVNYLCQYDRIAAQRPDFYIAISKEVQKRIKKYYHRDSKVLYPGIDLKKFNYQQPTTLGLAKAKPRAGNSQQSDYFLIVSRLVPYKRVEIAIRAFNQLGWPLKIVGTGRELGKLKEMAKPNVEFLGQLTDKELLSYYQNCRALILPQKEDLGLVAIEAQAAGKPVIAFQNGGAREIIINGKTGIFFKEQTVESLISALKKFTPLSFQSESCYLQAKRFDVEIFKKQFKELVEKQWRQHEKN